MPLKVLAGVGVLHSKLCGEFCKQNITTNVGGEGGFYKKESSPPYVPRLTHKSKFELLTNVKTCDKIKIQILN